MRQAWSEDKQAVFYAGKQTDLEQYSKPKYKSMEIHYTGNWHILGTATQTCCPAISLWDLEDVQIAAK